MVANICARVNNNETTQAFTARKGARSTVRTVGGRRPATPPRARLDAGANSGSGGDHGDDVWARRARASHPDERARAPRRRVRGADHAGADDHADRPAGHRGAARRRGACPGAPDGGATGEGAGVLDRGAAQPRRAGRRRSRRTSATGRGPAAGIVAAWASAISARSRSNVAGSAPRMFARCVHVVNSDRGVVVAISIKYSTRDVVTAAACVAAMRCPLTVRRVEQGTTRSSPGAQTKRSLWQTRRHGEPANRHRGEHLCARWIDLPWVVTRQGFPVGCSL